jgi:hypothetical protein
MTFSLATCSNQDFGARMAQSFQLCAEVARARGDRSAAERNDALAAEHLHAAMGYRREHSDELTF